MHFWGKILSSKIRIFEKNPFTTEVSIHKRVDLTPWIPTFKIHQPPLVMHVSLGCLIKALFSKSKMNTPESCSFWVTDTGNISFSTQIHCFHQVLASWLSSISLLELKIFLLTTPPCHTSKVASWHVDCRYELHFWYYLSKILSKSWKTCEKLWFEQ